MRKQLVLLLLVIFAISISTLFGTHLFGYSVAEATQSATACDSTLAVNSAFGTVSGSGNYPCGSGAAFGVTPTIITDGDVRHVFSGWTCSGAGCYSGSADSAFVTMGGNNSAITESAEWIAEYLLTLTASPSDSGNTNPAGSIWEVAGSVVQVNQQAVGAGWFFAYWSTDFAADAGSSSSYSITMDSPHAITANFIKLNITTELINVTSAASGLNLRNPDGTFYHGDEFQISSSIFVAGGGPLPNSIVPLVAYSYSSQVLTQLSIHQNGTSEFQVSDSAAYAPQTITATAYLKNEIDNVVIQSPATSSEPFAIVQYRPYFSDFTYMEYNNISSSTYQRPFVTLIRYDGNAPGYSYAGDKNTDPFKAYNSTMEVAFLNNFTFSEEGWSVSTNLQNPSSSAGVLSYSPKNHINVGIQILNYSYPAEITWNQRIWKFYFAANFAAIRNYISNDGIIYFNVTESAWYSQGTFHESDYNTSYLYEPVFYNGYLIFKSVTPGMNFNVTILAHNPDPLNNYLTKELAGIFGNDPNVIGSFDKDLCPAYSTTMFLKPLFKNSTMEVFLVNQTNMMNPQNTGVPYFTITVSGIPGETIYVYNQSSPYSHLGQPVVKYPSGQVSENITYNVVDEFGLFSLADLGASSPFANLSGYYLTQTNGYSIITQPAGFSFNNAPISYLVRTYGNPDAPFFITKEPGNLTRDYALLYGQNSTVDLNFVGGGITSFAVSNDGSDSSFYTATVVLDDGASIDRVTITSETGQILYNQSIAGNNSTLTASFTPPELTGTYTLAFPAYSNGTVSIQLKGVWGAEDQILDIPVSSSNVSPSTSWISSEMMNVIWHILVPVLLVFWLVVIWLKLRSGPKEKTPVAETPYPWGG